MGKLEKDLKNFFDLLDRTHKLIENIKARNTRAEVSEVAHKELNIPKVNKYVKNLIDFTIFPEPTNPVGRPVKYPDSEEEKNRFIEYREKGLSYREISEKAKLKKDVIAEKLKRYGIE